jgi:hypothetical protein
MSRQGNEGEKKKKPGGENIKQRGRRQIKENIY